ncbi:MMPL family transporter [Dactylosporangium sp. AC04546]|uniref:MMPL family transporter n=1 Tax=Dactylosporangium sp. AC04546 TaxID=2862460 RepID=UPI001EDD0001|nr:MMPL family transporter [Dactylosporangium sp. AC04546]WVK82474.1 MMPL family transporter [Dactylosporangium sp. AC04546]
MFESLGRFVARRRGLVLAAWVVALVVGVGAGGQLFDRLRPVDALSADAEAAQAERLVTEHSADGPVVYAVIRDVDLTSPDLVRSVTDTATELRKLPGVVKVEDLTTRGAPTGADDRSTMVLVELAEDLAPAKLESLEDQVRNRLHRIQAPSVLVGGDHLAERAFGEQAVRDLAVGESVAFALLLVALIVVFGGVVAAGLPLAAAVVGVSVTFLVLLAVSLLGPVGEFSLNIVTLLGLGLAVDYALLIVARYREERAGGTDPETAVATAMRHAGRAVAISGLAVAVALAGLAMFAEPLLASMAVGGLVVVLLVTALALTLVPALIVTAHRHIPAAGAETWVTRALARLRWLPRGSVLARLASTAQRRPSVVALMVTVGLLVLAAPLLGANFANSDARALPSGVEERRAYEARQALFTRSEAAPVTVVATVDPTTPQARDYLNDLMKLPGVVRLTVRDEVDAGTVIIDLIPAGATAGKQSREVVRAVRADRPAFPVLVGGEAAKVVDYQDSVVGRLPYVVAAVVLAMLILLYALTDSLVVPVKAMLLNALTFLATLGALVALFQWGWGEPILRFDSWGALDLTTPLLLFVFIFGLSMDYEVFLLSRIREEYLARPDNDRAVLRGITRSGPVVTAAAVCITIVFLGFATGGLVAVKEIGVGMAIAVILDVTVVRGLLLPAVMTLLGDLNWWAPRALARRRAQPPVARGTARVPSR